VTQIIIYAGAIMVLFLFVVMLLNVPREEPLPPSPIVKILGPTGVKLGALLSALFAAEIVWALSRIGTGSFAEGQAESLSSVRNIGRALFTEHAFAFEATSVLILVAMVGAVVLARKEH
jgi:NADH-quinone oxidoreductase subunit J